MAILITTPEHRLWQRDNSDVASVTIGGTYTAAGAIERSIDGGAFATAIASPTGGTFSDTFSLSTGQHSIEYRMVDTPADTDTVNNIKVGDWWMLGPAQSNMSGNPAATQIDSVYGPNGYIPSLYGNDEAYKEMGPNHDSNVGQVDSISSDNATAHGWVSVFASLFSVANDMVPVGFIPWTKNGTPIQEFRKTDANVGGNGLNLYDSGLKRAQAVGTIRGLITQTAEADASNLTLKSDYKTRFLEVVTDLEADLGYNLDVFIVPLHNAINREGNGTTTGRLAIQAAQTELAAENARIEVGRSTNDIPVGVGEEDQGSNDGLHFITRLSRTMIATRMFRDFQNIYYPAEPALTASSFTYKQEITGASPTVDNTGNQLVYITEDNVDATFWTHVKDGGGDVRFYLDTNLATRLPVHVVKCDVTTQKLLAVALRPSYTAASRNVFILCGNADLVLPPWDNTYGRNAVFTDYEAFLPLENILWDDWTGNEHIGIVREDRYANIVINNTANPTGHTWADFDKTSNNWINPYDSLGLLDGPNHHISAVVRITDNTEGRLAVTNRRTTNTTDWMTFGARKAATKYYGGLHDGNAFTGDGFGGAYGSVGDVDTITLSWSGTNLSARDNGVNSFAGTNPMVMSGDGGFVAGTNANMYIGSGNAFDTTTQWDGNIGLVGFGKTPLAESQDLTTTNSLKTPATFWTQSAPVIQAAESTLSMTITGLPDATDYTVDFTDPSTGELVARQTDITFTSGSATSNTLAIAAGTTLEYTIRTATHIMGDSGVTS